MRLSRIYLDSELALQQRVQLNVSTAHYVKNVLRLKQGQQITLFNGRDAYEYTAQIEFERKSVLATPLAVTENRLESPIQSSLIQALGKPEHIDLIVQKATELGVNRIFLFNSERTQLHLKGERLQKKQDHWHSIMISACEQCGRNSVPLLEFVSSLAEGLNRCSDSNKIVLDFQGESFHQIIQRCDSGQNFSMLVGAEGGLSEVEIAQAREAGFLPCVLGPRVLRMETAALSILTLVQHQFGDLN
ncbi:MAG: 16S rRNA (uracil(1498)-N(3))-methyltransferase [Gammaproteobacteria bacterium]|nr:16S rRNA (uracil(1498)-N(3))-methyltransferase [Gammaproteobacteria bacterium]MBL7000436.1 16S rRNA (uracil(1498)-N(3))-methyltransferase [Gammaproteobacteria bacterium]